MDPQQTNDKSSKPDDEDLSFELKGGRKFRFILVNGKPVKLGDGSFGVVFLVEESDKHYAAKLLYGIFDNDKNTPALREFKREMGILRTIRKGSGQNKPPHIVDIIEGAENFHDSNAYRALKKQFEDDFKIEVSQYVEVMELYSYTLKDLLERGPVAVYKPWEQPIKRKAKYIIPQEILKEVFPVQGIPEGLNLAKDSRDELEAVIKERNLSDEIQDKLIKGIINRVGYELLKSMSFEERIETIWPILRDVTEGLEVLHSITSESIAHLDIKPANIFIDAPYDDSVIQAYIGDFGFTGIALAFAETHKLNIEEALPLGTLHYRSPEQKDYRDVCYAKITYQDGKVVLEIRDPKFKGSIIEEGDFVIFSKDSTRQSYEISAIALGDEKAPTRITLNARPEAIVADEYTQVWLYKRQDDRTDIFGVGAVAYDLLTCGKSPERFYESIRRFEKRDNGEPGNVADVIEKYVQVSEYKSTEAGLAPIFEPLKDPRTGKYAPKWFVEWIVKCLLYQAEGTYYHPSQSPDGEGKNPFIEIKRDLQSFTQRGEDSKEPLIKRHLATANPLLTLEAPVAPSGETNRLSDKLEELQTRTNLDWRPVQGIYYFKGLVELLGNKFQTDMKEENRFFFFELLPENIIVIGGDRITGGSRFEVSNHIFKDEPAYRQDLRDDEVYKRLIQDISNPFVPARITFMRRRIHLAGIQPSPDRFAYSFLDSSQLDEPIREGDWIVAGDKLYTVEGHDQQGRSIKLSGVLLNMESGTPPDPQIIKDGEAVLYHDLDRRKYYLEMLGLYLYNLFFAENSHTQATRSKFNPAELRPANSKMKASKLELPKELFETSPPRRWIPRHFGGKNPIEQERLDWIYKAVIHILVKLIFHEEQNSYYQCIPQETGSKKDFTDKLAGFILEDLRVLRRAIEQCFHFIPGELDSLQKPDPSKPVTENIKNVPIDWNYKHLVASCFERT